VVTPSTPKPNVSTAVQTVTGAKAVAARDYNIPTNLVEEAIKHLSVDSILSPAYVAKIEQLVEQSTKHWDALKNLQSSSGKRVLSPGRVLSSIMGEPSTVMWDALKDLDLSNFDDLVSAYKIMKTKFSQMSSQEMFGAKYIEGHHPIQVESVAKASKHLPVYERLKFVDNLAKNYTYSGNNPKDMFGLSVIGHQNNYNVGNPVPITAHQSVKYEDLIKPGFVSETGNNWSTIDFTGYKDADSLAEAFWQQSGEPQMRIAEIVFDGPAESTIRQNLADEYGVRERDLYAPTDDKKRGENLKKLLSPSSVLNIVQKAYGSNGP
jgi:hypothetical protein